MMILSVIAVVVLVLVLWFSLSGDFTLTEGEEAERKALDLLQSRVGKDAQHGNDQPTLRSLLGAAPDLTGGMESVEWLRRQREGAGDE